MNNLNKLRRKQTLISSTLFLGVFYFFVSTTHFEITEIQLSYFGIYNYGIIWNLSLILLSISFYFNYKIYILSHYRLKTNKLIRITFNISFISLFLTGAIDMNYYIHNVFAYSYFFSYPLGILLLAHFNSKNILFSTWCKHLIFASLIIIPSLILLPMNNGLAVPEITHSSFILLWNIWILSKK